ncbi:hypothetical protein CPB86DRAFT_877791 [Serendipita vermifera]|nr:hypothetical protein CPB86DRAFT_877791 [Serendipita vermifera]
MSNNHNYPNVIVFGDTGVGKSSIVNMLEGDREATVSSKAKGETFMNEAYEKIVNGRKMKVFDTVGLSEGDAGRVPAATAIKNLYNLLEQLDNGVSLLVYVMRGPRITETIKRNYRYFYEELCDKKVPIVLAVTGMENEEDKEKWWNDNNTVFKGYGMYFAGRACITATKGKTNKNGEYIFQDDYNESKIMFRDLISQHCSPIPWKMPSDDPPSGDTSPQALLPEGTSSRVPWLLRGGKGLIRVGCYSALTVVAGIQMAFTSVPPVYVPAAIYKLETMLDEM